MGELEYRIVNGELYHHGVKGQRWGVRRYQNKNGSLTSAGRKRLKSAKPSSKINKGKRFVDDNLDMKVAKTLTKVKQAAVITSGILWVASALVPGAPALNAIASVTNLSAIGLSDSAIEGMGRLVESISNAGPISEMNISGVRPVGGARR